MKRAVLILSLCLASMVVAIGAVPVRAESKVVSAFLASGRVPTPAFDDIHLAFTRIVVNESGFNSLADQDGILRALMWRGGGRKAGRDKRGQGYGLDYSKLMKRMVAHSTRTFPTNSRFLALTNSQRVLLSRRQTRQNRWTSTLRLNCSEPTGWPKTKLDGSRRMDPWRSHYGKRCQRVVRSTRAFLQGKLRSHCDAQPTTWGSILDIRRPGGALESGWDEVHCDRPNPNNPDEVCDELTKEELLNSKTCARNTFWTWATEDKEAEYVRQERAAEPGS